MQNADIIRIENTAMKPNVLDIRWRVTTLCNYQCSFCIQGDRSAHLKASQGESAATRAAICEALRSIIESSEGYQAVNVSFIGGEVTILKDFPDIFEQLAASAFPGHISFHITTNLSRPARYYIALYDTARKHSTQSATRSLFLNCSFYSAYTSRDQFENKLRTIATGAERQTSTNPKVRISTALRRMAGRHTVLNAGYPVLKDDDYRSCLRMNAKLAKNGIRVTPIIIREYETSLSARTAHKLLQSRAQNKSICVTDKAGHTERYSDMGALGLALEDAERFCPRGCFCDAGIRSFWVNAFGDVYRCPTLGSDMRIGSLLEEGPSLLSRPEPCTSDHCSCKQFGLIEAPSMYARQRALI